MPSHLSSRQVICSIVVINTSDAMSLMTSFRQHYVSMCVTVRVCFSVSELERDTSASLVASTTAATHHDSNTHTEAHRQPHFVGLLTL